MIIKEFSYQTILRNRVVAMPHLALLLPGKVKTFGLQLAGYDVCTLP
jgi:hypothetical protein